MDTVVQGSDEVSGTEHGLGSATETSGDIEPGQKRNTSSRSESLNKGEDVLSGFPINDWTRPVKATRIDDVDSLRTAPATATSNVTSMNSIPMMKPSSVSSSSPTTTGGGNVSFDSVFRHQQQQKQQLQQRNMLSFSPTSKSEGVPPAAALSYLPPHMVPAEAQNAGYHSGGGLNSSGNSSSGVYHLLGGIAGSFTPAQWLELEQQALIYKYITANQPIPQHLLIPIQKALQSAGFYGFNPLKPTTAWGWGAFQLGYSNSTDPEPGRCRRTDGKKWRCSRDAVPDQKYCERHMNRGRHRSRKHVEGLNVNSKNSSNGHSGISGTKIMSSSTMNLASPPAMLNAGASFDSTKNFQSPSDPLVNRMVSNRVNNSGQGIRGSTTQFSFLPQSINLNTTDNSFSITKAQYPYEESNSGKFGVVHSSGSIFSTTSNNSTNSFSSNNCSSSHALNQQADHLGLWPRIHTPDHQSSNLLWPGGLHSQQPDNTQLSMSLPKGPADFMSSTSSPIHEKSSTLSPLRLSTSSEMGTATHMSLGVGLEINDHQYLHRCDERQTANWIPISWEGGPLGEVLHSTSGGNTSSSVGEFKVASSSSSHPNQLLPDTGSQQQQQQQQPSWSPTGVLQRSALVSLSNSSAGSSPRADNSKATESGGFGLCNDLLGLTTTGRPSSLPAVD